MRVGLTLFLGVVTALLAGCGGGSGSSSSVSSAIPNSPAAAAAPASSSSVDAVAYVAKTPIPKVSYEHWVAIETTGGVTTNAAHRALGFLITSDWMLGEAAAQHLALSESEVTKRLAQIEKQSFPKAGALQKFLTKSGETKADLLAIIRVELLKSKIVAKVTSGKGSTQTKAVLANFEKGFQQHWKVLTTCDPGYVMEDCSEHQSKAKEPNLTGANSSSASTSTHSSSKPSSSHSKARRSASRARVHKTRSGALAKAPPLNIGQELPPARPGEMTLSSPAFEVNGLIPSEFTCDGAGVSPSLEWKNVPKSAAALILFVIDGETNGPDGGIRWIVGDINPKSTGVAAGQVPEGGIVGTNMQGHAGYSGICPAHGKTTRVEFVLFALSKRIALTPGFQPSTAEYEYGGKEKIRIGKAAVTYGGYYRP
jgi:phosphatidylethanolamine-binding protein (PEBP) family uncharacterized protein